MILALLAAFLMGAVDAILNIMVLAYICRLYPDEQTTAAYALRNMLQVLSTAIHLKEAFFRLWPVPLSSS